jgi:hypothetical protein
MSEESASTILTSIWSQVLHIVDDALHAVDDKHLSLSEIAELSGHGVQLVATILRLVQHSEPQIRADLREQVQSAQEET